MHAGRDRSRFTRSVAAGAALLVVLLVPAAASAQAPPGEQTQTTPSTFSWSVLPTPTDDEPARALFNPVADPGDTVRDSLRIKAGANPVTLQVYASDAYITEQNAFDLLPASEKPVDVGSWVKLDSPELTVGADQTVDIPFTITVPPDATPGDHIGGIVTSISTVVPGSEGSPVRTDRRLGTRLYLQVKGDVTPSVAITGLDAGYTNSWNPFGNGSVSVTYRIRNTGNVRVQVRRRVEVSGLGSSATSDWIDVQELLPGGSTSAIQTVRGVAPVGRLTVTAEVAQRSKGQGELPTLPLDPVSAGTSLWAIPWTLLLLIIVVLGTATYWLRDRWLPAKPASPPAEGGTGDGDGDGDDGDGEPDLVTAEAGSEATS
jgi:hypothetical protein